jgi:hypothetical protein
MALNGLEGITWKEAVEPCFKAKCLHELAVKKVTKYLNLDSRCLPSVYL